MRNQQLIEGENVKTHLAIHYTSPIISESLIPIINSKRYVTNTPIEKNIDVVEVEYVQQCFKEEPVILFNIDEGKTHLSNQGLIENDEGCCRKWYAKHFDNSIDLQSIYDPRFYGYCDDSWRPYVEDGRVKYDYSDIDYVKFPHFISRTKLEQSAIPMNQYAVDHFTEMQITQRDYMQQKWLERRASDRYQQKLFPIHTNGKKTS